MDKLTALLMEAKPLYIKQKRSRRLVATGSFLAVAFAAFLFSFQSFRKPQGLIYDVWSEEIYQAQNGSVIQEMGLPIDEYGLLKVI